MNPRNIIAFLALLLSLNLFAQDWKVHRNSELEFRAEYLGEPKTTIQKVPTDVGVLDMHMVSHQADDSTYMSIIRTDYPEGSVTDTKVALDGAVNGAVNNVRGKLIFDNEDIYNGFPGRKIKIHAQGMYLFMNAYLVNDTMYIAQVVCIEGSEDSPLIDKFLNSFDIIKVKKD
jgi:hypothetical protein